MTIREQTQELQSRMLSPRACLSQNSAGREQAEEECPTRTAFARDRDRIIHANSFRRLMHKTQVFLSPEGDHYRTRLTHTLEVNQIAKTMATALRLNEELTEAIALGHDLGHTPFGHAGERVLQQVCPHGFSHAQQSVRVLQCLERDGRGLNLTHEVLDGIACHSLSNPSADGKAKTLEGRVVYYADKIAYLNHDIEDAIRAKVLTEDDVPFTIKMELGRTKSQRISTLITSILENSDDDIEMDEDTMRAFQNFNTFMYEAVYLNPLAKSEEGKAQMVVERLYRHFTQNPQEMPQEYRTIMAEEDEHRAACDYISGMSDRYAITIYEALFIPKSWGY